MNTLLMDIRYATRALWRTPAFTIAAVLTLALGIGANTAIFSIVDGVLLRPAPVANADQVMVMWETDRASGTVREPSSLPDFLDFIQRSKSFAHLAAFTSVNLDLIVPDAEPSRVIALGVTSEFTQALGVTPIAGRTLTASEALPSGPRSALISEELAARLFGTPQAAIGKTVRLSNAEWSVVGVMPASADFGIRQVLGASAYGKGFAAQNGPARVDVWVGLRADPASLPRDTHPLVVFGRLAAGATPAGAQAEMTQIAADLEQLYPSNRARGAFVEPLLSVVFGNVRPAMLTLLGAVTLVLLVACANVANLLLVRAAARTREVSVRVALGAGTGRLARQFLTEGALLTGVGTVFGIMLAYVGLDALRALAPANLPRIDTVAIDTRVLAVAIAVSLAVAGIVGLIPLFRARRRDIHGALRGSAGRGASAGREHRTMRHSLIVSELAMASLLMVGAGLLIKSLWRLQQVDAGFSVAGVLKAEYTLPASRYPRSFAVFPRWPEQARFDRELEARLAALPGVESVALASNHPLDAGFTSSIRVVGRESEGTNWPEPAVRIVSPGYFATLRVAMREGRAIEKRDDVDAPPVVLVNSAAAQRYFNGKNAIGQQISLWGAARTVIGVVHDERFNGLAKDAAPGVYLPIAQAPPNGAHSVLVRVRGEPAAFADAMRAAVKSIDPLLPLFAVEPMPETMRNSIGQQRFTMLVLGIFAAVTLLLAAVGVHGVLSYSVAQRTSEIGVRMALGANAESVRALVLREGGRLAAIGLAIGLAGALVFSRLLAHLLYGTGARDPLTFIGVATMLTAVALLAAYIPARRAARIDPLTALRAE